MPKRVKPPDTAPTIGLKAPPKNARPVPYLTPSDHEALYRAEHSRHTGHTRNATFAQLQAQALATCELNQVPERHLLTKAEMTAIYEYTTDSDFIIAVNTLLRERPAEAQRLHQGFFATLQAATAKLPNHQGQVWRGSRLLSDEDMERHTKRGSIVRPGYPWSTTYDREALKDYPDEMVFDIACKTGKNIAKMSAKPSECEVLFPASAAFRVARANLEARQWAIRLVEVAPQERRQR